MKPLVLGLSILCLYLASPLVAHAGTDTVEAARFEGSVAGSIYFETRASVFQALFVVVSCDGPSHYGFSAARVEVSNVSPAAASNRAGTTRFSYPTRKHVLRSGLSPPELAVNSAKLDTAFL